MTLRPIYGHEALLHRLAGALASSRFPQASLLVGPSGSGKQRIALWVAQGLLCDNGPGEPCGQCPACVKVLGLGHPDVHWFVPIPRPKAGDPQKQIEQASELLGEVWAERRENPNYQPPDGMSSHSLASVRLLQRVANLTPFEANRKVIILGDAERLIVQKASQEAANALLKVLEEPPADTVVILTTADPQALLPTIRSRLAPIRIGPVGDSDVKEYLENELEPSVDKAEADRRVVYAGGCIGKAIWYETNADQKKEVDRLLAAISDGPQKWTISALAQQPWAARGAFSATLDALTVHFRDEMENPASSNNHIERCLYALQRVQETRNEAQGNANPQLALAVLAGDLERIL